jgi:MFS family permease
MTTLAATEPSLEPPSHPDTIGRVLRNRAFLRLWMSQAFSQVASNMVNFALLLRVRNIVEVHDIKQANTAISLVILSFSLPAVLFGPIAGVIADKMNKKVVMGSTHLLRAVAVCCFIFINPKWHVGSILIAIYLVTFLFGIAGQFFAPAEGSTLPVLVPRGQLISANALFNLTNTGAQLIGFATVGPILIKIIGIDHLFEVSMAIFVVCAGLIASLPRISSQKTERATEETPSTSPMRALWRDIKEGLVFILQDPILIKAIAFLTLAATTFLMIAALGPDYVTGIIGLPKEDIGLIVGPAGTGVFIGVLIVGRVASRVPRERLIDFSLTAAGINILILALAKGTLNLFWPGDGVPLSVLTVICGFFAMLLGFSNAFILIPAQTMLQERTNEEIRARVYATFFTISNTVAFVPIFFAAASADLFGVVEVLTVVGLIVATIGAFSLLKWNKPAAPAVA